MYKLITILILLALSGCNATKNDEDEYLTIPQPLPGHDWKSHSKEINNMRQTNWVSNKENGHMKLLIHFGQGGASASGTALTDEYQAKKACNVFNSRTLFEGEDNGFDTSLSTSSCKLNNREFVILVKHISGYDSFYSVFRRWEGTVTEDELNNWVSYFKKIKLCKPGWVAHPCPKGFKEKT